MSTDELYHVEWLLRGRSRGLALDLLQCLDQTVNTTKHTRREKALSYLLEMMTDDSSHYKPTRTETERTLSLVCGLLANVKSEEAKVGLQRAEARLRWFLDNPENLSGSQECIACGEVYEDGGLTSHRCTNATARSKDAAMQRDDSVQEVS